MARASQLDQKRKELVPILARAFSELGYRRATTAELASRCRVQENILYRLWPDKRGMFIAALHFVYDLSIETWTRLLRQPGNGRSTAERVLNYEAQHHGEFGHYRIVFAGLGETDDPEIRRALSDMYRRFHGFITEQIQSHRGGDASDRMPPEALSAWAFIGLGTISDVLRELGLVSERQRSRLFRTMGSFLLSGDPS